MKQRGESGIAPANVPSAVPESPGIRGPLRAPLQEPTGVHGGVENTPIPGYDTQSGIHVVGNPNVSAPASTVPRGTAIISPRTPTGAETLAKALIDDGISADQAKLLTPAEIKHYGDFTPGDALRAKKLMEGYESIKASPGQIQRLKDAGALDIAMELHQAQTGGK
jgi:hypothetical protein